MRILTISNTPHNPNQGSGYAICNYTEGLRARGHTVDAYGPEHYMPHEPRRARRYLRSLMMAWFGVRKAAERGYDLVECWGAPSWILAGLLAKSSHDFALVHHSNGIEPHSRAMRDQAAREGLSPDGRWFQLDLTPLAEVGFHSVDAIITLSEFDAAYARSKRYVNPEHVYAINDPLPASYLDQQVSFDREKRVGYCGSWIERKGTEVMKQDLARFLRAYPAWTFSLAGVGEDFHPREHFPSDVQEQIEVNPFVPRERLIDWYRGLAVLLCPSIYESFGLVQTEAMACGAALVATETGYAASLEDRRQYVRLPVPRSPKLFDALTALADDDALRRRVARNGYETVQGLRWDPAVDRLEAIYESLVRQAVAA